MPGVLTMYQGGEGVHNGDELGLGLILIHSNTEIKSHSDVHCYMESHTATTYRALSSSS